MYDMIGVCLFLSIKSWLNVKGNCTICGKSIQNNGGFFIEVPIENQLLKFFSGKCKTKYVIVFIIIG